MQVWPKALLLALLLGTVGCQSAPGPGPQPQPSTASSGRARAEELIKQGQAQGTDHKTEAELYAQAIAADPGYWKAWHQRGHARASQEDLQGALDDFSQAIELKPDEATSWVYRGHVRYQRGEYELALADHSQAVILNPKEWSHWYERGKAHFSTGDNPSAIADYSQAIALDPQQSAPWAYRGQAHLGQGERAQAIKDFSRSIEIDPQTAWTHLYRGHCHYDLEDFPRAQVDYEKLIELAPNDAEGWSCLAAARTETGDRAGALTAARKAIELAPETADHWARLAYVNLRLGTPQAAIRALDKALELNPSHGNLWNNRAAAYNQAGDYTRAVNDCDKAIELTPQSPNPYRHRAEARLQRGNTRAALEDCDHALELKSDYPDAWRLRGTILLELGDYASATQAFQKALELLPLQHRERSLAEEGCREALQRSRQAQAGGPVPGREARPDGGAGRQVPDLTGGRTYVLIVGINDYADAAIPDLNYAEADARALTGFYVTHRRSPTEDDRVLTLLGAEASRRTVLGALRTHLQQKARSSNDTVVLFFAGHGFADADETYLATQDSQLAQLPETSISSSQLRLYWDKIQAGTKILITDACHAGGLQGLRGVGGVAIAGGNPQKGGTITITAAGASELSAEDRLTGHGVFTNALLNALRGDADQNGDRRISLTELQDYLLLEVRDRAQALGKKQTPGVEYPPGWGDLPLTR